MANNQNGYCTIDQWRNGQCTSAPVVIDIPFSQLGEFVFHCHILEHEDGGMQFRWFRLLISRDLRLVATAMYRQRSLLRRANGSIPVHNITSHAQIATFLGVHSPSELSSRYWWPVNVESHFTY